MEYIVEAQRLFHQLILHTIHAYAQLKHSGPKPSSISPYTSHISSAPISAFPSSPSSPPRVHVAAAPAAEEASAHTTVAYQRDDSLATLLPDTPGEDKEASEDSAAAPTTAPHPTHGEGHLELTPVVPVAAGAGAVNADSALGPCIRSGASTPSPQIGKRFRRPPPIPAAIAPTPAAAPPPAVSGHGSTQGEKAARKAVPEEAAKEPAVLLGPQEQASCSERGNGQGQKMEGKLKKKKEKEEDAGGQQLRGQGRVSMGEVGRWLERFDGRFSRSLKTFEQCMG